MRRPLSALGAALLLTLLAAAPVAAHTSLLDGSPGPGDEVAAGTDVVVLELAGVQVDGEHVVAVVPEDGGDPFEVGAAVAVDPQTVCARVEPLGVGVHAVEYDVTSDDGHPVQGRYLFEVTEDGVAVDPPAGCTAADLPEPDTRAELDLAAGELPGWVVPVAGAAVVVSAVAAVVAVTRNRRADEGGPERD